MSAAPRMGYFMVSPRWYSVAGPAGPVCYAPCSPRWRPACMYI
ncbi:Uncharacterised protein [Bordetella pertussis]|nr:Uncharacterised protein [Bordetella pertussis]